MRERSHGHGVPALDNRALMVGQAVEHALREDARELICA